MITSRTVSVKMVGGTAVDCQWRVRKRTWAVGEHFRAPLEGAEGEVWVFCFVSRWAILAFTCLKEIVSGESDKSRHYCLNKSFVEEGVVL